MVACEQNACVEDPNYEVAGQKPHSFRLVVADEERGIRLQTLVLRHLLRCRRADSPGENLIEGHRQHSRYGGGAEVCGDVPALLAQAAEARNPLSRLQRVGSEDPDSHHGHHVAPHVEAESRTCGPRHGVHGDVLGRMSHGVELDLCVASLRPKGQQSLTEGRAEDSQALAACLLFDRQVARTDHAELWHCRHGRSGSTAESQLWSTHEDLPIEPEHRRSRVLGGQGHRIAVWGQEAHYERAANCPRKELELNARLLQRTNALEQVLPWGNCVKLLFPRR
eukprot:CAMPEP_0115108252 /NCGR_PEP_ID=MMETSP0227-20121206/37872_1 /TAXON_ID=89957 /ORGANISM="Polarella glacialis, Strain CCMP 1383" /LENGTH=279 /DNA_ID=CAMNT_0002506469 /DNA_START=326 /DNA_END=1165 /DNA_ORIENTATION=+